MKTADPTLVALLNSSSQFIMADLYTLTLPTGTVLQYTNADVNIYVPNRDEVYLSNGPLISRSSVRVVRGLEVDTLELTIAADGSHLVDGVPLIEAAFKGALDGAKLTLRRAFLTTWSAPPVGDVILFAGRISDVSGTRTEIKCSVKSALEALNISMPRNLYQAGCLHTVYDGGCALDRAANTALGQVTAVNGTGQWVQTNLISQTSSYFDEGVLHFTSGANTHVKRTVKRFATGQFWFALPLPALPSIGDTFEVYPGCDKKQSTCINKFHNVLRFRGYPYIPLPETAA